MFFCRSALENHIASFSYNVYHSREAENYNRQESMHAYAIKKQNLRCYMWIRFYSQSIPLMSGLFFLVNNYAEINWYFSA